MLDNAFYFIVFKGDCYEFQTFAVLFVEIATVLFFILEVRLQMLRAHAENIRSLFCSSCYWLVQLNSCSDCSSPTAESLNLSYVNFNLCL